VAERGCGAAQTAQQKATVSKSETKFKYIIRPRKRLNDRAQRGANTHPKISTQPKIYSQTILIGLISRTTLEVSSDIIPIFLL
jgi:hypothetical protein